MEKFILPPEGLRKKIDKDFFTSLGNRHIELVSAAGRKHEFWIVFYNDRFYMRSNEGDYDGGWGMTITLEYQWLLPLRSMISLFRFGYAMPYSYFRELPETLRMFLEESCFAENKTIAEERDLVKNIINKESGVSNKKTDTFTRWEESGFIRSYHNTYDIAWSIGSPTAVSTTVSTTVEPDEPTTEPTTET